MEATRDPTCLRSLRPVWRVALAALVGAFAIQLLTVFWVHGGAWTGPFLIGEERQREVDWPLPVVASPAGTGYDGQFYLQLALDPAVRGLARTADLPRYRARRILVPTLAWVSGFGQPRAVVAAYYLWCALFVALGAGALALAAVHSGRSPWWGMLFLLQLGTVVCLWRMVLDGAAAALALATLVAITRGRERLAIALLAASLLARETTLLLWVGIVAAYWLRGRRRLAAEMILAPVPMALWWAWLHLTVPASAVSMTGVNLGSPLVVWVAEARGAVVPWVSRLVALKELSALAAALVAIGVGVALGLWALRHRRSLSAGALGASLGLFSFSLLGLVLGESVWNEPWAYSRVLLPVPVLAAFVGLTHGFRRQGWLATLLPAALGAVSGTVFLYFLLRVAMP